MDSLLNVSRRGLVKWGIAAAGLPALTRALGASALAQDAGSEGGKKGAVGGRADEALFTGKGLPGGGQLEIRLTQTMYTSDPDQLEVAQRMKPFDLESWITEWTRVAERNEQMAEKFAADRFKVTASEYYLRAAALYRDACWPQPVTDSRMLPTYKKARDNFDKAWKLVRPPFERVQVPYEGKVLDGYFRKPGGNAQGKKFPAVIAFQGADTMAEAPIMGGGAYTGRRAAPEGSSLAAGHGKNRQGHDRLPRESPGCGRHSSRDAGNQHGRLRSAARRERREETQGRVYEQRLLRFEVRSVRVLPSHSGAGPVDHRRRGPGRCPQKAW